MADSAISGLPQQTTPSNIVEFIINDAGTSKKVTLEDITTNSPVGSVTLPGIAFSGDQDTGIYRVGANSLGIATGGVAAMILDSSQNVSIPNGTLLVSDNNSGIHGVEITNNGTGETRLFLYSVGSGDPYARFGTPLWSWAVGQD